MPFDIHPVFLIGLLAIVLIIFGPGKLPQLGGAMGRGIREFRHATTAVQETVVGNVDGQVNPDTATAGPPSQQAEDPFGPAATGEAAARGTIGSRCNGHCDQPPAGPEVQARARPHERSMQLRPHLDGPGLRGVRRITLLGLPPQPARPSRPPG